MFISSHHSLVLFFAAQPKFRLLLFLTAGLFPTLYFLLVVVCIRASCQDQPWPAFVVREDTPMLLCCLHVGALCLFVRIHFMNLSWLWPRSLLNLCPRVSSYILTCSIRTAHFPFFLLLCVRVYCDQMFYVIRLSAFLTAASTLEVPLPFVFHCFGQYMLCVFFPFLFPQYRCFYSLWSSVVLIIWMLLLLLSVFIGSIRTQWHSLLSLPLCAPPTCSFLLWCSLQLVRPDSCSWLPQCCKRCTWLPHPTTKVGDINASSLQTLSKGTGVFVCHGCCRVFPHCMLSCKRTYIHPHCRGKRDGCGVWIRRNGATCDGCSVSGTLFFNLVCHITDGVPL
jgi:hypothetical protein